MSDSLQYLEGNASFDQLVTEGVLKFLDRNRLKSIAGQGADAGVGYDGQQFAFTYDQMEVSADSDFNYDEFSVELEFVGLENQSYVFEVSAEVEIYYSESQSTRDQNVVDRVESSVDIELEKDGTSLAERDGVLLDSYLTPQFDLRSVIEKAVDSGEAQLGSTGFIGSKQTVQDNLFDVFI